MGWDGEGACSKNSFDEEKREGREYVCGDFEGEVWCIGSVVEWIHTLPACLHLSLNICVLP
jgi:hypothetical protein